jgi:uroporphyrinogen-III synthase
MPPQQGQLSGFTVATTADRRRDGLAGLLERHGARVVPVAAVRIVLGDDRGLRAATLSLVDKPPDIVVAIAGTGIRSWLEAADGWGLGDRLRRRLAVSRLVACGPRTGTDSADEVFDRLLAGGVAGTRIAFQPHGEPQPELVAELRAAGADVVEVPVYTWAGPADTAPLRRLVDLITGRLVDAVAFTSVPAVDSLLRVAGADSGPVLHALRTRVVAACTGPATAGALAERGVPAIVPARPRLEALARLLVDELPRRASTVTIGGTPVTLRGHAVIVGGTLRPVAPAPMAVLRALAAAPGRVLSRSALLRSLPQGADEHAVEMAVARLRAALGGPRYVQTVVKRGYRLSVD